MKLRTMYLIASLMFLSLVFSSNLSAKPHSKPVLVKGSNLTISIFKTSKEQLSPFLNPSYEPALDEQGNYRVFLGVVSFSDTFGLEPFSEFIIFTEVKPQGVETEIRYFLPIWVASDTQSVSQIYSKRFGMPIEYVENLDIVLNEKVQNTRLSASNAINGKYKILMSVSEASDEVLTDFTDARLIGIKDGKTFLNKDIFAARFRAGKIEKLKIKASKDSPLKLLDVKNHIYTLFSDNHTTYIQRD